jgi:hypothetical protein
VTCGVLSVVFAQVGVPKLLLLTSSVFFCVQKKISGSYQKLSPSCAFSQSEEKKFTHLAKRGKETAHAKAKTPLIVAHLLFHTSKCLKRSVHPEC